MIRWQSVFTLLADWGTNWRANRSRRSNRSGTANWRWRSNRRANWRTNWGWTANRRTDGRWTANRCWRTNWGGTTDRSRTAHNHSTNGQRRSRLASPCIGCCDRIDCRNRRVDGDFTSRCDCTNARRDCDANCVLNVPGELCHFDTLLCCHEDNHGFIRTTATSVSGFCEPGHTVVEAQQTNNVEVLC